MVNNRNCQAHPRQNHQNPESVEPDIPIYLRLRIEGRELWYEWSYDGENYTRIGRTFDTTKFSDEYCKYGEFTGTFVGLTCADRVLHKHYADFDFFSYEADEEKGVPAPEEK